MSAVIRVRVLGEKFQSIAGFGAVPPTHSRFMGFAFIGVIRGQTICVIRGQTIRVIAYKSAT